MANILFDKSDIAVMSPITQKLDALLKEDGFSLLEAGREENGGTFHNINVNRLEYMRDERERVYIYTHEKAAGGNDGI